MKIMTLGYEGMEIDDFFRLLKSNNVEIIVDVRELPLSRKRGFSKSALSKIAEKHRISYVHFAQLGCPKAIRNDYRQDKDWARYTRRFKSYLATQVPAIESLCQLALSNLCCLICFEEDPSYCHRSYVAQEVANKIGPQSMVHHLTIKKDQVGVV